MCCMTILCHLIICIHVQIRTFMINWYKIVQRPPNRGNGMIYEHMDSINARHARKWEGLVEKPMPHITIRFLLRFDNIWFVMECCETQHGKTSKLSMTHCGVSSLHVQIHINFRVKPI